MTALRRSAQQLVYAGFWRRLAATLIDFSLLLTLLLPVYLLVKGLPLTVSFISNHWAFNLTWFVALVIFWGVMGATPGKRLLNCKIVKINKDNSVSDINFVTALLRALAYIISAIPIYLGFFWIAFDNKKRGFHDLMLNTVVIIDDENYDQIPLKSLMEPFSK
ncbi:MAG: RDD family protein [Gammaproteobacteria bacterium]